MRTKYALVAVSQATGLDFAEARARFLYVEWDVADLQALRATLEAAYASTRGNLKELVLWYTTRAWFLSDIPPTMGVDEEAREDIRSHIEDLDYIFLSAPLLEADLEAVCERTESDQMHVGFGGVWWSADEKYGLPLESRAIEWARMLEAAQ